MKTYFQFACLICLLLVSFACAKVSPSAEENAERDAASPILVSDPDAPTHEPE